MLAKLVPWITKRSEKTAIEIHVIYHNKLMQTRS